jgi:hypothetical protein
MLMLALALLVVLAWQWGMARTQHRQLKVQVTQRRAVVQEARTITDGMQRFLNDFMALATRDSDASAIAAKYQVRRANPPPAPSKAP